ncbi:Stk1 family PASTA domain-containing Ser/Thr kinase [Streptomyces sp. NPDC005209]|uniref:Stk1 family PASTA domain-containing Ser/Thr kinase n=1 Tax=Streptomyces sp. NPDC005209 TaxID=3156715 RepID=UPI0033ABD403
MDAVRGEPGSAGEPVGAVGQGRYALQAPLGEGGMASVFRAHDSVLGRTVAVKTLHSELARDPSFRARFRREAQAVAALSHANIVAVHDSGEDAGDGGVVQYIVMEYVRGRSLGELIRDSAASGGTLPLDRALAMTASVLDALEYSHRRGLVHRDIKPANVMVTDEGTVKVMDFGIARALLSDATAMTRTGTVLGTPHYLSPEQAQGKPADARSDLYSVGCMLFELVTNRLPFDGESTMAVLYQHVQQPPPVPSSVNASLPSAVDVIVARALSKDPANRYPSAEAMADDIRRAASGRTPTMQVPLHDIPTITAPADTNPGPVFINTSTIDPHSGNGAPHTVTVDFRRAGLNVSGTAWARRSVKVSIGISTAIALGSVAIAVYFAQSLFSGSYSPDPRATGALSGCSVDYSWGDTAMPPSFTGMSPAEAKSCAEIAGLKVDQKTALGTKSDKDTVVKQEPGSSQEVEEGSTVTIYVSTGGDPRATGDLADCEVEEIHGKILTPAFTGRTKAKARLCADIAHVKLQEAGTVRDKNTAPGQVAKQEPVSWESIQAGSTVKVWISSGGDPRATGNLSNCDTYVSSEQPYAPNLTYMTTAEARLCAKIAHIKLEEHTIPDRFTAVGNVVKQEPDSSTHIEPGGTVRIWISAGSP